MKTLNNLNLQIKATLLTAILLTALFTYMFLTYGFTAWF